MGIAVNKVEQNKQKKKDIILATAKSVFLNEGYVAANMDNIAKKSQITKQTIYRYFPSKLALFTATLHSLSEDFDQSFTEHLQHPDAEHALLGFAKAFVALHLSEQHIDTCRLLIAEGRSAPEIIATFHEVGEDDMDSQLITFFQQRLGIEQPQTTIKLWTGMLLSLRMGVLLGMASPNDKEVEQHAITATTFLLNGLKHS